MLRILAGDSRFTSIWAAISAGHLASVIAKIALPVFAATETGSPLVVSAVAFALTFPWLLFGLPAGALVDRFDRRRLLLAVTAVRGLALGLLVTATILGIPALPALLTAAFVLGACEVFVEPLATALVPAVVPPASLDRANSRLIAAEMAIDTLAQPLGGALVGAGLAIAGAVSGVAYLAGAGALLVIGGSYRPAIRERASLRGEIVEGLRFIWDQPVLRSITWMAGVINACWVAWSAVFVLYALDPGPMGLTSFEYGLLMSAEGLGGALGVVTAGTLLDRIGRRWAIGVNIIGNGLMFAAPALTPSAWLIVPAVIIGGVGGPMWGIVTRSFQQRLAPDHLRGRVSAGYRFIGFGSMAVGPIAGGLVAELWGVTAVFVAAALLTLLLLVPFARVLTVGSVARATVVTEG